MRKRWEESRVRVLENWDEAMQDGEWCLGISWGATMGDHEALLWRGGLEKRELEWAPTACLLLFIYEACKLLQLIQKIAELPL